MAATVAVIAARKREEIFTQFRESGAVSPSTALPLEELGLGNNPMLHMQTLKGSVVRTGRDRFYLDVQVVERQRRLRRRLVSFLLAILVVTVLILWLTA